VERGFLVADVLLEQFDVLRLGLGRVGRKLDTRERGLGQRIDFEAERIGETGVRVVGQQPFGFFLKLGYDPLVSLDGDIANFLESHF